MGQKASNNFTIQSQHIIAILIRSDTQRSPTSRLWPKLILVVGVLNLSWKKDGREEKRRSCESGRCSFVCEEEEEEEKEEERARVEN